MSEMPRGGKLDRVHFSGTIVKKLKDGTEVLSSYVDAEEGEELLSQVAQSEAVEAADGDEEATEMALKEASKTQPEAAKPAQVADEKAVEAAKKEAAPKPEDHKESK